MATCRSQWPRSLRCRSTAAHLLRSWVWIPPEAWMFVCCKCCVLSDWGLCDELITCPEESYLLWCVVVCDQETSRMRPWLAFGRSATEKKNYGHIPENGGWGTNSGTFTTVWKTMLQALFMQINPLHTQWPTHRMSQLPITQQQNLITIKSTSTFSDYSVSWITGKRHFLDHILSNMNPVHNLKLHFFKIYHILKLSSHLRLVLPSGLLLSGCLNTMLYALLISLINVTCTRLIILKNTQFTCFCITR
jgi:hypothetical protein